MCFHTLENPVEGTVTLILLHCDSWLLAGERACPLYFEWSSWGDFNASIFQENEEHSLHLIA